MNRIWRRGGSAVADPPPPVVCPDLMPIILSAAYWFDYVQGARVETSGSNILSCESLTGVAGSGPNGLAKISQGVAAQKPQLGDVTLNPGGTPTVIQAAKFDGVDDFLSSTDAALVAVGSPGFYEEYSVWQMRSVVGENVILGFNATANDLDRRSLQQEDSVLFAYEQEGAINEFADDEPAVDETAYTTVVKFHNGSDRFVDLVGVDSDTSFPNITQPTVANYAQGGRIGLTQSDFSEIFLLTTVGFDRELADNEVGAIITFLQGWCGLPLVSS